MKRIVLLMVFAAGATAQTGKPYTKPYAGIHVVITNTKAVRGMTFISAADYVDNLALLFSCPSRDCITPRVGATYTVNNQGLHLYECDEYMLYSNYNARLPMNQQQGHNVCLESATPIHVTRPR